MGRCIQFAEAAVVIPCDDMIIRSIRHHHQLMFLCICEVSSCCGCIYENRRDT